MKLQKKDVWRLVEKKREKIKRCIHISQQKGGKSKFCRKMNQDVNGNRKLFWKEVSKVNEVKVESCSRIRDENGRLAL